MRSRLALFLLVLFVGLEPAHSATLIVSFDTTTNQGEYEPTNIVAVWIEDSDGTFVKTIGRWATVRVQHLVAWNAASGRDTDAVSGATRRDHQSPTPLAVVWDMTDRDMQTVPDGTYTIRIESGEDNSSTEAENHQGSFSFEKNDVASTQMVSGGGFENVVIDYSLVDYVPGCDNGIVDRDETCDPVSSCPTVCEASSTVCMENALYGLATECTARCVEQPVTDCTGGDGCCPGRCTAAEDSDCDPEVEEKGGSCSTTPGKTGAGAAGWLLFALLCLWWRSRIAVGGRLSA